MKDRKKRRLINAYTSQNERPLLRGVRKKPLHQPMEMMKATRRRKASWVLVGDENKMASQHKGYDLLLALLQLGRKVVCFFGSGLRRGVSTNCKVSELVVTYWSDLVSSGSSRPGLRAKG